VLAVPLAVLANHFDFPGKRLATAALMVPMILPPFVGALAMRKMLAHELGSINLILSAIGLPKFDWLGGSGFTGVVIMEVLHLYPIMFLNASAALANVDPTMVEASRNLGAGRWRTFWRVTLPLIRPGLFAGGTIVFIWAFTELGTPLMFDYHDVLPVQIYDRLNQLDTTPKVYSMVFVMLSAAVAFYGIGKMLFGRGAAATAGRGVAAVSRKAGPAAVAGIWAAYGVVILVGVLPHVGVLLMSVSERWSGTILPASYTLDHLRAVFEEADTWNSIVNSLRYASAATILDIILGLTVAFLAVRARIRGSGMLDALAMLPLAVPGLVIASGYIALTASGPLAALGPRNDPTLILIIAYSVRRLPYMVRSISAGLQQTSETLEEASRNLGAGPLRTAWRVTAPLISANILAGSILTFSFAMLEVSDSLILAQTREFYPITKQIYEMAGLADTEFTAAALGTFGMALLTATLLGANLLLGKRMGAMFRV
jgi:iron(III) transport system permease protein